MDANTKLANAQVLANLLTATRALVDRDVALGIVDEGDIKLSITKVQRKQIAKAMASEGMSQREIAAQLGVTQKTVSLDLADTKVSQGAANGAAPKALADTKVSPPADEPKDAEVKELTDKQKAKQKAKEDEEKRVRALCRNLTDAVRLAARDPEFAAQDARDFDPDVCGPIFKGDILKAVKYLTALAREFNK